MPMRICGNVSETCGVYSSTLIQKFGYFAYVEEDWSTLHNELCASLILLLQSLSRKLAWLCLETQSVNLLKRYYSVNTIYTYNHSKFIEFFIHKVRVVPEK